MIVPFWAKYVEHVIEKKFIHKLTFPGSNILALVPPWICAPRLSQKPKWRMANAESDIIFALTQFLVLCTLTHVKSMSWGWLWVWTKKWVWKELDVVKKSLSELKLWLVEKWNNSGKIKEVNNKREQSFKRKRCKKSQGHIQKRK